MKVLFKGMHRDVVPMDIEKDRLLSVITNVDYSKPYKLKKHIYPHLICRSSEGCGSRSHSLCSYLNLP